MKKVTGSTDGGRSRGFTWTRRALLLACHFCSAALAQAGPAQQSLEGVPPPLYQSLKSRPGPAQSMIFGPGTTEGSSLPQRSPRFERPVSALRCERRLLLGDFRTYSGLENATAAQVTHLGIVLRTRSGEAKPFLTGRVVLLRSGRYAECQNPTQHQTLLFGAEWAIAFQLQPSSGPAPRTVAELASFIRHGQLDEFGYVINGDTQSGALEEQLRGLQNSWNSGEGPFLERLEAARDAWPASRLQVDGTTPLGVVAP